MYNRKQRFFHKNRWSKPASPGVAVAFGGIAFGCAITYGIANQNVIYVVIGCLLLLFAIAYAAVPMFSRLRHRPRNSKGHVPGTPLHGDWHPTYNTRQYMLRRGRHAAKLGRQGREIETDKIEKDTDKEVVRKDKRNI